MVPNSVDVKFLDNKLRLDSFDINILLGSMRFVRKDRSICAWLDTCSRAKVFMFEDKTKMSRSFVLNFFTSEFYLQVFIRFVIRKQIFFRV